MEDIGIKIIIGLVILLVVGIIVIGICAIAEGCGEYECIDLQGNEIRCIMVWQEESGAWGTTEDGRTVQVISYKKVVE